MRPYWSTVFKRQPGQFAGSRDIEGQRPGEQRPLEGGIQLQHLRRDQPPVLAVQVGITPVVVPGDGIPVHHHRRNELGERPRAVELDHPRAHVRLRDAGGNGGREVKRGKRGQGFSESRFERGDDLDGGAWFGSRRDGRRGGRKVGVSSGGGEAVTVADGAGVRVAVGFGVAVQGAQAVSRASRLQDRKKRASMSKLYP